MAKPYLIAIFFCLANVPWTSGRNLLDYYDPYRDGPGEGCYSVCLSKEIKLLHEEIKTITPPETGSVVIPELKRVQQTTDENSNKLDELLKEVRNIAESGSSGDIEGLKKQLDDAKATISALREEKHNLTGEAEKAVEEIRALVEKVAILQKSLEAKAEECDTSISQLKKVIQNLQGQMGLQLDKIAELEAINKALKKQLEAAQGAFEKLKKDLAEEKRAIEEARAQVENLAGNLVEEKRKLKESEKKVQNLEKRLAEEKSRANANHKLIEQLTQSLKVEGDELNRAKKRVDDLTQELAKAKANQKAAEERAKRAEARLNEEFEKEKRCEASLKKIKTSVAEEKAKAAKCGGDLADATKGMAEKEAEVKQLAEKLASCKVEREQASKDAREMFENMKKDMDDLMKQKASLTTELVHCKQSKNESTNKAAELEVTVKAKQTELDQLSQRNKVLREENTKKTAEITKLKEELKDALENPAAGDELKKLKEENGNLKKENETAMKQIKKLEEEILTLNEGRKTVPVKFSGASFGATSEAPFCEAKKAFTGGHYESWTTSEEAPQTVWVKFKEALRLTRFSFKCAIAPENGASKFELVATNDATCNGNSNWDVIYADLSGKGFTSDEDTITAQVDSCKMYKCYGIRVLDVNNIQGQKWVIMSEINMWARG